MQRAVIHLMLAVLGWTTFYCAVAVSGIAMASRPRGTRAQDECRRDAKAPEQAAQHATSPSDEIAAFEDALVTSDYPSELGSAMRAVFRYHSQRKGDEYAMGRLRELLARNRFVANAHTEGMNVHLVIGRGLTYVVHL